MGLEKYNPQTDKGVEKFYGGSEINREDIIAEAAVILEGFGGFPDPTKAEVVEFTKAKMAIRRVLENKGINRLTIQLLEPEIKEDAEKLLALFK